MTKDSYTETKLTTSWFLSRQWVSESFWLVKTIPLALYMPFEKTKDVYSETKSLKIHRYLIPRLSLKVVYLWRHVSSAAPPFILWWWNLEILLGLLNRSSPFIGELRCQAIQIEHALIQYSSENPKRSLYCEMSVFKSYVAGKKSYLVFFLNIQSNGNCIL
jgi:hypothetical protein